MPCMRIVTEYLSRPASVVPTNYLLFHADVSPPFLGQSSHTVVPLTQTVRKGAIIKLSPHPRPPHTLQHAVTVRTMAENVPSPSEYHIDIKIMRNHRRTAL